jgi:hypothetical protein
MKLSITKEIALVLCLKVLALTALWFFFVHGHVVPHDTQETGRHVLGMLDKTLRSWV